MTARLAILLIPLLGAACRPGANAPAVSPVGASAPRPSPPPARDDDGVRCRTADECLRLARRHAPDGAAPNPTRMARYDARACELGSARGCARLGDAYATGHPGFAHDDARAAQLWSLACDDDDADACESAARAHHFARGVPRDDKRAQGYLDRACRLGLGSACGPLERVFGGAGHDEIDGAVADRIEALRGCYNLALLADPAITGRITVRLATTASGLAAAVDVGSNDTGDPELGECIVDVVSHVRFPTSSGAAVATAHTVTLLLIPSHAGPPRDTHDVIVVQGGPTAPNPGAGPQP